MAKNLIILNLLFFAISVLTENENGTQKAPFPFEFPKDRKASLVSPKVIGKDPARPNSYPFLALLEMSFEDIPNQFCGATLLTPEWVLTAAHCVENAIEIQVYLGVHDKSREMKETEVIRNTTFFAHKNWDPLLLQNDIALIRLPECVDLNSDIATKKTAQRSGNYGEIMGKFMGRGLDTFGKNLRALRYVDMKILTTEECKDVNKTNYEQLIADNHLCTSGLGNIGICNSDSGSPLITDGVQVGIASLGHKDCLAGFPSVFTRVSEYDDRIPEHTDNRNNHNSSTTTTWKVLLFLFMALLFVIAIARVALRIVFPPKGHGYVKKITTGIKIVLFILFNYLIIRKVSLIYYPF